jgi:uncharacterized protein
VHPLPLVSRLLITLVVGVAAGISNGIAGGGTFLTFPTLLALGVPALQANVSSSVGVVPSYVGGLRGFGHLLRAYQGLLRQLLPTCVVGVGVGIALLFSGSAATFRSIVPWLIGVATIIFAFAPVVVKQLAARDAHRTRPVALQMGIFLASVYGGYFGAGLGIILLAVMGLSLEATFDTMQALRNALSLVINLLAAVVFLCRGHLALASVLMLLLGTLLGGYAGTHLIRRLSPAAVRALIVAIGLATTVRLAVA